MLVVSDPHGSWLKSFTNGAFWDSHIFSTASYSLEAAALLHLNKSVSFHSWRMPEAEEENNNKTKAQTIRKGRKKNHQSSPSFIANRRSAWHGKVLSSKPRGIVALQDRDFPCLSYNMWILANTLIAKCSGPNSLSAVQFELNSALRTQRWRGQ